jgi:hypothetical protein
LAIAPEKLLTSYLWFVGALKKNKKANQKSKEKSVIISLPMSQPHLTADHQFFST